METTYSVAKVCKNEGTCLPLDPGECRKTSRSKYPNTLNVLLKFKYLPWFYYPDLNKIMSESRDYDELLFAWQGWRNASGRELRQSYKRYVELANLAARSNGEWHGLELWGFCECESGSVETWLTGVVFPGDTVIFGKRSDTLVHDARYFKNVWASGECDQNSGRSLPIPQWIWPTLTL